MKLKTILSMSIALMAFAGCKQEEDETTTLSVDIKNVISDSNLALDTRSYPHPVGHTYNLTSYKYFISDIKLLAGNGDTTFLLKAPLLVDANVEESMSLADMDNITNGYYEKIFVTFGLKKSQNKENNLSGFNESQMAIPGTESTGYYHMMVKGTYDSLKTNRVKPFELMTNAVGEDNNSFELEIPASSFLYNKSTNIQIGVDFNQFFQNPNTIDFKDFNGGIATDQGKQKMILDIAKTSISVSFSNID